MSPNSQPASKDVRKQVAAALKAHREYPALVQCLTNPVVPEITANVLLAAGASPAMVDNAAEAEQFCRIAQAALVNVGNPSDPQLEAMEIVARVAHETNTPWVLDPVAVGVLDLRTEFAKKLLDYRPTAIRGNASEVAALAGAGEGGRGVDSTANSTDVIDAAKELAQRTGGVVAVSGKVDVIVTADDKLTIRGGHAMCQKVVGTGCSLGALVASYLGAARAAGTPDLYAVAAAHAHAKAAARIAARTAEGPGTFASAYIDGIYEVADANPVEVLALVNVSDR